MNFEQLTINDRKIIVGIDFGTTYSGVAWAETHRPDRRTAITSWPISNTTREGESSDKVPTSLRFTAQGAQWGFSIPADAPRDEVHEWFKLDLDPAIQTLSEAASGEGNRGGKNAEELVTEYLFALIKHLSYTLGEKLGQAMFESIPFEFVVTVPAIWRDLGKDKTRVACQRAVTRATGEESPSIHLVSEPEAAAIYALHGLDPHGLEVGDSFVICDAGGGTVDLISYTITRLKPIVEVKEAAPGTGSLCGSTFLNRMFATFLRDKLGNEEGFDDELMAEAMERFEKSVKRQFTMHATANETWAIPVGGLANNKELGISRGRLALKSADLQDIFEPIILEVIKLVKDQISSSKVPMRAVMLVGGFGASIYLKDRLRNALGKKIEVLQPSNAWLAVVQGAVMKGLAQSAPDALTMVRVRDRRARKHYGHRWRVMYDPECHAHLRGESFWSNFEGYYMVPVMDWFITRGDVVSENEPFTTTMRCRSLTSLGPISEITDEIYVDETSRVAPMNCDTNVTQLCRLTADLRHIPEEFLGRALGADNKWYYELEYQIEALYLSASTQYTLIYNNQRYNTVTAEYV